MSARDRIRLPRDRALDVSLAEPYRRRFRALKEEGEDIRRLWRDIDDAEVRERAWWLAGDDVESIKRMANYSAPIINNTILDVARTLAGGIYSGLTPPSKEWYRIRPASDYLEDDHEAEDYLARLTAKTRSIIARSIFYAEIYKLYWDASFFGMSSILMEDDPDRILSFMTLPPGSYWPAGDGKGRISSLFRRYVMTLENVAEEFGVEALPDQLVYNLGDSSHYDDDIVIIQAIQPVRKGDREAPAWAKYESVYLLEEHDDKPDRILKRAHYRVKPFAVFRWSADLVLPYPRRWPGRDVIGDCKQLNLLESDKLLGVENIAKPALAADADFRGKFRNGYPEPGEIVFVDKLSDKGIYPIIRERMNLTEIRNEIAAAELRIQRAFYNHYFMAMLGERKDMTKAEVDYRAEEKAAIIGAVTEQFSGELLPDILNRVVDAVYFHDLAPPPPDVLQGMETRYEYIGPLTISAQVLEGAKIDSLLRSIYEMVAGGQAEAWDSIDIDQAINVKAKAIGVNPDVVRSFDTVKEMRAARNKAAAEQQQGEALERAAAAARNLGSANTEQGTLLGDMTGGGDGQA